MMTYVNPDQTDHHNDTQRRWGNASENTMAKLQMEILIFEGLGLLFLGAPPQAFRGKRQNYP